MRYIQLVICIFAFSCSNQNSEVGNENQLDSKEDTNLPPPPPPPSGKFIDRKDEFCLSELEKAKTDARKGLLVYTIYNAKKARYDEEFSDLLRKFNIVYKPLGPNCTGELNCYGLYMDSLITVKYGEGFIQSLRTIADHMFEANWAIKTYDYWDVDIEPSYQCLPADTFIMKKLTLPNGWDYEPIRNERQYIDAEFVIDTTGTISIIEVGNFGYNLKNTNEKYLSYLKREIKSIIERMQPWSPGVFNSHKVKCWYLVDIDLDRAKPFEKNKK